VSGAGGDVGARGRVDKSFVRVGSLFQSYLADDPSFSAQLCVYRGGDRVVDLAGGPQLDRGSVTGVFSVSKGVAAVTMAVLIDDGRLELDRPVAAYWPEFRAADKGLVTVRQLLSHQAGLVAVDGRFALTEVVESAAGADRLARQRPHWQPGTAFGYHALTIGILMEELVRRVAGGRLQELYDTVIRAPRDIDVHLGLPEADDARYVPIQDAVLTIEQHAEVAARPPVDALAELVFDNVAAAPGNSVEGITTNNPLVRRAGPAAIGGVGSAGGLARLYAAALGHVGAPVAARSTFEAMSRQQSWGIDRTLNVTNCFGTVFMTPQPRLPFGGHRAFGHDGAGGALAFADPETELAFGYIPVPMQHPPGADHRSVALARLARECARAAGARRS
jgi:CubicO group peptidase (beta-lactamase class C family)